MDEAGGELRGDAEGELWVRGPAVFHEYWRRPEATAAAFAGDWFKHRRRGAARRAASTACSAAPASTSSRPAATRCRRSRSRRCCGSTPRSRIAPWSGIADEEWGERVAAAVVPRPGPPPTLDEVRGFAKERLAPYKAPRELLAGRGAAAQHPGQGGEAEGQGLFEKARSISRLRTYQPSLERPRMPVDS